MQSYEIAEEDVVVDTQAKLGEGGFGAVYRCQYSGHDAAIKILTCKLSGKVAEGFRQELETMARLLNPNIIRTYGGVFQGPTQAIVMEIMPKGSLYQLLRQHPAEQLPWSLKYRIALDIAHGIKYLHDQQILHRDLKSLNVLLDDRLRAKLCDFGLAEVKTASKSMSSTKVGTQAVGTVLWMSPELFGRKVQYTPASDIYALGMVLFELLTHQVPFEQDLQGRDPNAVIPLWLMQGERPEIPANAPETFQQLIERCWVQDAIARPAARDVVAALKPLLNEASQATDLTPPTSSVPSQTQSSSATTSSTVPSSSAGLSSGPTFFGDFAGLETQQLETNSSGSSSDATSAQLKALEEKLKQLELRNQQAEERAEQAAAKARQEQSAREALEQKQSAEQAQLREQQLAAEAAKSEAQRKLAEEKAKQAAEEKRQADQKAREEQAKREAESRAAQAAAQGVGLFVAAGLNQEDVDKLVTHVARDEQDEAEAMLKINPKLALAKGKAVEYCGREFEHITAFQFACWALGWHMWEMIRTYLPEEAQRDQLAELMEKGTEHGPTAEKYIQAVIDALRKYTQNKYVSWNDDQLHHFWTELAGAQWHLPAHARAYEECELDRERHSRGDEGWRAAYTRYVVLQHVMDQCTKNLVALCSHLNVSSGAGLSR